MMSSRALAGTIQAGQRRSAITLRSTTDLWGKCLAAVILIAWAAGIVIGFQTSLLLLVIVAFALVIIGIEQPAVGLLGISMLCTMDSVSRYLLLTGGLLRWNSLNYWLLITMAISVSAVLKKDPQSRLLQAFVIWMAVGVFISPDRTQGLQDLLNVVTQFGLVCYVARGSSDRDVWFSMGLVNGVLAAAGSLVFYLQRDSLPHINANAWALFPNTAIFTICLCLPFLRHRPRSQHILILLAVVNYACVFLSGSRGSILVGTFSMLFLLAKIPGTLQRASYLGIVAGLCIVVVSSFVELRDYAISRLDKSIDSNLTLVNRTSGRSDLALAGWYIFLEHPLGVGTGGFAPAWSGMAETGGLSGWGTGREKPAHSGWIKILAENGLPGILLFLGYVLSFAVTGWRSGNKKVLLFSFWITGTLGLALLATEFQGKGLWLLAACGTVLLNRIRLAGNASDRQSDSMNHHWSNVQRG